MMIRDKKIRLKKVFFTVTIPKMQIVIKYFAQLSTKLV